MVVRKIFFWLFIAFLIFFVAVRPAAAATGARLIGTLLGWVANGFSDFASRLVS
jgi:hypothetical protein